MAKNVKINGVTYSDVPSIEIPLANATGDAEFFDTSDATLDSGDKMLSGNTAYADGRSILERLIRNLQAT